MSIWARRRAYAHELVYVVALTGEYILSVRYSREGFDRPLTIFVDDVEVESLDAAPTGRRGMYATADLNVSFGAGSHTVRLLMNKGAVRWANG